MNDSLRTTFFEAVESVLIGEPGIAVVHSSFASLAPPQTLTQWDVLYAIDKLVSLGWTFAFPAFTFSFTKCGKFDRETSPSETGVLADWVRDVLPAAQRTDHPIYSFVVVGPQSQPILNCTSQTTFGETSPFAVFEKHDAKVVMLGSDWTFCTPFHRYEELAEVPYRSFKAFEGQAIYGGAPCVVTANMYVRNLNLDVQNNWQDLITQLTQEKKIERTALWRGHIEATTMQAIRCIAKTLLTNDNLAFVKDKAHVRYRLDMLTERAASPSFRVALLGSSNLDPAKIHLSDQIERTMPGRHCTIFCVPFGQLSQQVMNPASELNEFSAELTIFADRIEDILGTPSIDLVDPRLALEAVEDYAALVRRYSLTNGASIVVHRFALVGRNDVEQVGALRALVDKCNEVLTNALEEIENIIWIDMANEVSTGITVNDARLWHLGRIPYSNEFKQQIVMRWVGIILAQLGKTVRLLILDLDNTMWGGVLGEDGPEGIAIGGDFPGNAFARFQRTIKGLSERGIVLAVSSKNDEDLALEVLNTHSEMIIRPSDLVSHRINWQPKWQNIREIAAELDLGLGSVMFVDDNPIEREAVKCNLPMVKVLDLPDDPTLYAQTLHDSPYLEILKTGREDIKRASSYKKRRKINLERAEAADIFEFLRGLEMKIFVQPLNGGNAARAAQLCQKTNQFNTTTRRYSARDLDEIVQNGGDVAVIGLQDKYSERENIALMILQPDPSNESGVIDLFLMSCRVLGRTVEQASIAWALSRAHERGWGTLSGEVVETPRNTPARNVYADNEFEKDGKDGYWKRRVVRTSPPDWFDFHDGYSAL